MAIAVVVDGGGGGIEPTALMVVSLTMAVVDGGSNNGVFTTTSYNKDYHPCPHRPCLCPPLDKDQMAGWRVCHDASHLLSPWLLLLVPSLSLLAGQWRQGQQPQTDEAVTPISTAGKRWDTMTPLAWINKKQKQKEKEKEKKQKQNKNKKKNNNKNKNKQFLLGSWRWYF